MLFPSGLCMEAWHCVGKLFFAELGIGCCHKGTPDVIVAMNTYSGQSAHFCFSVAKFGTAKPLGFYGTLRSHKGFQQIFLFLPASALCVFASGEYPKQKEYLPNLPLMLPYPCTTCWQRKNQINVSLLNTLSYGNYS